MGYVHQDSMNCECMFSSLFHLLVHVLNVFCCCFHLEFPTQFSLLLLSNSLQKILFVVVAYSFRKRRTRHLSNYWKQWIPSIHATRQRRRLCRRRRNYFEWLFSVALRSTFLSFFVHLFRLSSYLCVYWKQNTTRSLSAVDSNESRCLRHCLRWYFHFIAFCCISVWFSLLPPSQLRCIQTFVRFYSLPSIVFFFFSIYFRFFCSYSFINLCDSCDSHASFEAYDGNLSHLCKCMDPFIFNEVWWLHNNNNNGKFYPPPPPNNNHQSWNCHHITVLWRWNTLKSQFFLCSKNVWERWRKIHNFTINFLFCDSLWKSR